MITNELTGAMGVNPTDGGNEGDRILLIEPAPAQRVLIGPIPQEVAHKIGKALLMSDDELKEQLTKEQREAEAQAKLHLPAGVQVAQNSGAAPGL